MKNDDQEITDEELQRLDEELQQFIDLDDDQEITDEELQRLIDINGADSGEPGGISPRRRSRLLRDTENRIREHPPIFIEYLAERRSALIRGASADEIDALTEEWAEHYGIDLDALDEEWVGTDRLKLKQISRIKNEAEQDAALEQLATEQIEREDRQEAKQPVHSPTDEWYAEQRRPHYWRNFKYRLNFFYRSLRNDIGDIFCIIGWIASGYLLYWLLSPIETLPFWLQLLIVVPLYWLHFFFWLWLSMWLDKRRERRKKD